MVQARKSNMEDGRKLEVEKNEDGPKAGIVGEAKWASRSIKQQNPR